MLEPWLLTTLSVLLISLISLVGFFTVFLSRDTLNRLLLYLVSLSIGGLFGGVFFHLLPEIVEEMGFVPKVSFNIILGVVTSLVLEKFLWWRHSHLSSPSDSPRPLVYMNSFGDAIHNFIDGTIIGGSYLLSPHLGLATTLAVVFHEIPQEIGDFGVLVYGGLSRYRALLFNFLSALTSFLGAITVLALNPYVENLMPFLIPFAAGNFIYIAGSDLIPEIRGEVDPIKSLMQLMAMVMGILILFSIRFLE